jgi:predicted O-methyltransferase YrrM
LNFLSLYKRQLIFFFKKKINIDLHNKEKNLSLENLFIKYGSDKAKGLYNNKNIGHGYTKFYLKNLEKLKYKKLNILEIGSYAGASAAAFSKFFPKSKIFCLDINISNFKYVSKNINVFGIDATKEKSCRSFIRKANISSKDKYFDIIIDDGSHHLGDILNGIKFYFKYIKPNGFYVVEDFRLPNFFKHLNVVNEPKIDKLIHFIKRKKNFKSKILNKNLQNILFEKIASIKNYHGKTKISDIVFFKKN